MIGLADSFERIAKATRLQDICRPTQGPWEIESPDMEGVIPSLQRVQSEVTVPADQNPILLKTALYAVTGMELMGTSFPYGVFFPDRALEAAIDITDSGELFINYDALDGQSLDSGFPTSTSEFFADAIASGGNSLWELLIESEIDIGPVDAILIVLSPGKFGVISLDDLLHSTIAKTAFFALTLDLERAAHACCRQMGKRLLTMLPPARLKEAVDFAKERASRLKESKQADFKTKRTIHSLKTAFSERLDTLAGYELVILDHTKYSDKKSLLLKAGLPREYSKSRLKSVFEVAEKIRNWCAHTTSVPEVDFDSLSELRKVVKSIRELCEALASEKRSNA